MSAPAVCIELATARIGAGQQKTSPESAIARVVTLTQQGRYPQALAAADAGESALDRAQAKLYVEHQAGDLGGALAAGLDGLRAAPHDRWLLERMSYIAISLRATALAKTYVERLAAAIAVTELPDSERTRWHETLSSYRAQVAALEVIARETSSAEQRARMTSVIGLAIAILVLWLLAWPRSRAGGIRND
jgi:hypothetical protein